MSDTLEDIDTSQLDNVGRVKVDTPSRLNILDIPTDCTRLVFDRLTLNQLIHLRAVCHPWNDIITLICQQKLNLKLSFSSQSMEHYYQQTLRLNVQDDPQFKLAQQNTLTISHKIFCDKIIDSRELPKPLKFLGIGFIARLFPNITNFVCILFYQRLSELNYILSKWSTKLHTLTIFCNHQPLFKVNQIALHNLNKCLEKMVSLRRFHLFAKYRKLSLSNVRTFGQLEEFSFDNANLKFVPYFAQLDANRCTSLRIGKHFDDSADSPDLSEVNPQLVAKLTHLATYFDDFENPNHISQHCAKFCNLIHLEILQMFCPISDALDRIIPLKKLHTLVLKMHSFVEKGERVLYIENPNYVNTFPVFHDTIRELHLLDNVSAVSCFSKFHEYSLLAKTFPRVEKICIVSNHFSRANFDVQFRPRFCEAFGKQVMVEFCRTRKFEQIED